MIYVWELIGGLVLMAIALFASVMVLIEEAREDIPYYKRKNWKKRRRESKRNVHRKNW